MTQLMVNGTLGSKGAKHRRCNHPVGRSHWWSCFAWVYRVFELPARLKTFTRIAALRDCNEVAADLNATCQICVMDRVQTSMKGQN